MADVMLKASQEALEAEAEGEMGGGMGRSISTMSLGSGEREHLAHQLSGSGNPGSSPHFGHTGDYLPLPSRRAMHQPSVGQTTCLPVSRRIVPRTADQI